MRSLDGITDLMDEFEQTQGDSEGPGDSCAAVHGVTKSLDMTEQLNNK